MNSRWLALNDYYFTLDGSECDKIGVGEIAFLN